MTKFGRSSRVKTYVRKGRHEPPLGPADDARPETTLPRSSYIIEQIGDALNGREMFMPSSLMLCVTGSPHASSRVVVEETMPAKSLAGRPLQLRRIRSSSITAGSHLLLICRSGRRKPGEILSGLREVNTSSVERAGLGISAKLLRVATLRRDSMEKIP